MDEVIPEGDRERADSEASAEAAERLAGLNDAQAR